MKTISKPQLRKKPPIHGWNYDDWVKSIEESDDEETNLNIDFPIRKFQSWCASQPKYPTPESLFLDWFKTKYPAMDTVALKALADDLVEDVMENRSISSENTTSDKSPDPTTPFTELLNGLNAVNENTAAFNVVAIDDAQSSMGLLQMFPAHDEDEYVWDHNTSQIELSAQNSPNIEPASDLLEKALQPRTLFVANNDYNDESITSEETDADDVFNDPSILEVSINGTKRFSRNSPFRRKAREENVPTIDAGDDDHGYTAEVEEEPEDTVGDDRPRRRNQRIDYSLFHRFGKKR